MKTEVILLETKIRRWIILFVILLILSGVTAFPLETELKMLIRCKDVLPDIAAVWMEKVYLAIVATNKSYPYLSYGTDWLAFAHIVIGVAFIGPLKDPVRNIWVIEFGMIACVMVFPLAFIAGTIRGIPFYWQLIDCSFGLFGLIPLIRTHKLIKKLSLITYLKN